MNFEKAADTSYKPQIGHKKQKLYEMFAAHSECGKYKILRNVWNLGLPLQCSGPQLLVLERDGKQLWVQTPEHRDVITKHCDAITEHCDAITEHCDAITEHGDAITEHCDAITEHCDAITEHCDAITEHYDAITEHCDAITEHCDAITPTPSIKKVLLDTNPSQSKSLKLSTSLRA